MPNVITAIFNISTHDLTRRSTTEPPAGTAFVSVFQLTTSRGGRPFAVCFLLRLVHFNSRPHEEVDYVEVQPYKIDNISTHDLTRRSTMLPVLIMAREGYFNSRPHEEVDGHLILNRTDNIISTHDLTRRSTVAEDISDKPYVISTHDLTRRSTSYTG